MYILSILASIGLRTRGTFLRLSTARKSPHRRHCLGLAAAQDYVEVCGLLPAGKRLVLMSDGVVEARSKSGELYGFERLAELTKKPAQEIADVAKRFGQEDDISVLTIACAAQ